MRNFKYPIKLNVFILFIYFALSYYFYSSYIKTPGQPFYDAIDYLKYAEEIYNNGLFSFKNPKRTFFYPFILSKILTLSIFFNIKFSHLIFLFQFIIYYFAVLYVSSSVKLYSKTVSLLLLITLLINVFVIPYIGVSLTDLLYCTISLFIFGWLTRVNFIIENNYSINKYFIFIGVVLTCINITIRPLAIWLIIPVGYYLLKLLLNKQLSYSKLFISLIFGVVPLLIQCVINFIHYNSFTFFPVIDLGSLQVKWGIENIKYSTWVGGLMDSNFYPSSPLVNINPENLAIG